MQHSNSRVFAVVGVVVAAIAAAALVMPAARQLGPATGLLAAAAIIGIPVLLVLAVSGAVHYGVLASSVVAVVVAGITCVGAWAVVARCAVVVLVAVITWVVSWVVAGFALATAWCGSGTGVVLALVLCGAPALSVLILGLLALRVVPGRSEGVSIHRDAQPQERE